MMMQEGLEPVLRLRRSAQGSTPADRRREIFLFGARQAAAST
jgi:hypothetical protein